MPNVTFAPTPSLADLLADPSRGPVSRTAVRVRFTYHLLHSLGEGSVGRGLRRIAGIWLTGHGEWLSGVRRSRPSLELLKTEMLALAAAGDAAAVDRLSRPEWPDLN